MLPPSQTQPTSSSIVLKSVVTAKGKHYSLNSYSGAYNRYANITSITLPNNKYFINPYAFSIQAGLTEIHAKAIDPKNYHIMEGAFGEKDMSGITLYVPAGSKADYAAVPLGISLRKFWRSRFPRNIRFMLWVME